jgi:hypothetical protein
MAWPASWISWKYRIASEAIEREHRDKQSDWWSHTPPFIFEGK